MASTSRPRSSRRCSSRSRTATRTSTGRSRPSASSSATDGVSATIAREAAAREPALGRGARPSRARARAGLLAARRRALRARARDDLRGLSPPLRPAAALRAGGRGHALLLGDYLYAHGLVRIAAPASVEAVRDLAELISLCAGPGDRAAGTARRGRRRAPARRRPAQTTPGRRCGIDGDPRPGSTPLHGGGGG